MFFVMKEKNSILLIITLILGTFWGCQEMEDRRPVGGSWESTALEGYEITPINGGAEIRYNIPNDPDILYVMAEYERDGRTYTEKASVHTNVLTIEGFHRVNRVKATLYKVNREEQRSKPVEVEFEPLESLIDIAANSLTMLPGFGGVVANWENPASTELGVRFMRKGFGGEMDRDEMYFTTLEKERRAFRGFEPEEATFAIAFEDKWGNVSDTTYLTTTPFFETLIPKPYVDFRANMPHDNTSSLPSGGRHIGMLWDNVVNTSAHGWLTNPGNSGLSMTIDIGEVVKLSRIVIHGYHLNSVYSQVNITQFELWGTDEIDFDQLSDRPYWLDETSVRIGAIHAVDNTTVLPDRTFKDDWEYLGWHAIPRYDRMVPPDPQAVLNLAANGAEYEMPIDARPVRYIRLFVREAAGIMPPPSNNYFSMGEITFYGDNTVSPQD